MFEVVCYTVIDDRTEFGTWKWAVAIKMPKMWCLFGDWLAGRSQAGIGKADGEGLNKVRKMLLDAEGKETHARYWQNVWQRCHLGYQGK